MRRKTIMLVVSLVLIIGWFTATLLSDDRPKLGLDLQGGISIVLYPVEGSDLDTLDAARSIIENRVNALGVAEPEVSRQGNTIVVDLAGVDDRDQAKELVGRTAELQFRAVIGSLGVEQAVPEPTTAPSVSSSTGTGRSSTTTASGDADESPTTTAAEDTTTTTAEPTTTSGEAAGRTISTSLIAAVRPAASTSTTTGDAAVTAAETTVPGASSSTTVASTPTTTAPGLEAPAPGTECEELVKASADRPEAAGAWLWDDLDPHEACYQLEASALGGDRVKTAKYQYGSDDCSGGASPHCVSVTFKGDDFVQKIATPYVNRAVAIVLDNQVISAPTINAGITGTTVRITGDFGEQEARDLALVLRYGSLPVKFDERQTVISNVSPTLGKDQLRAGIIAGLIGLALVALYMIIYYRLLGLVVWLGVGLTGMIMFSLVTLLGAEQGLTLTLSGVTGLIVSVGVTVDSYVVYYERLKDEVRTGKTIRSSLDSGFRRAFRTIVAADLVSLIGAGVLYLLAVGSVKGFAFFLMLSTIIDLLIAYFVMHPMVSLMARRESLVRMKGIGIAAGLDVPAEGAL